MSNREQRRYERAVVKRDSVIRRINSIHETAVRAQQDETQIPTFMIAIQDLDGLWDNFLLEADAMLSHVENISDLGDTFLETETKVRSTVVAIKAIAEKCGKLPERCITSSPSEEPQEAQPSQHDLHTADNTQSVVQRVQYSPNEMHPAACTSRLPEIPLPTFDGQLQNWPVFRDRFLALVANRPGISEIDKFYYLIGCLDERPTDALKGITVSSETYGLAWNTLVERFDKPRKLATNIIDKLISAAPVQQESYGALTEFLNTFDENIAILESLNIPDLGSFLLFVLAARNLPISCRKLFESENQNEYPHVEDIIRFVKQRVHVLENASNTSLEKTNSKTVTAVGPPKLSKYESNRRQDKRRVALVTSKVSGDKCQCCGETHSLSACMKFQKLSVDDRFKVVTSHRLCMVCFGNTHWASKCRLSCPICSRRHHSLLHREQEAKLTAGTSQASLIGRHRTTTILLGTALVHICDAFGTLHVVRALIDSGSQISAITTSCVERLGLRCSKWTVPISGLSGQKVPDIKGQCQFDVQPRDKSIPVIPTKAWVMPRITGEIPANSLSSKVRTQSAHLALADPAFDVPSPVELLLGADVFPQIWCEKTVSLGPGLPSAFLSIFGWILIGPVSDTEDEGQRLSLISLTSSVEKLIEKFWEVEEPAPVSPKFTEHGRCEQLFCTEASRDTMGKFIVPLPLREDRPADAFNGSKQIAIKRFKRLEDKLGREPELYDQYRAFMLEYEMLGHMTVASRPGECIIPHHGVQKVTAGVAKLRVVFDGSAQSVSGVSLNDCLYPGPKLQADIVDILFRFRMHRVAFTCDICKMYRQFWVHDKYRPYQHIVWRPHPHDELKEFELNTVTYGLNCAPYLALRVLREIAKEVQVEFPEVSYTLRAHTYMDDICTGADTVAQATSLQIDIIRVLSRYGLELRKWSSNSQEILAAVPADHRATGDLPFNESESVPVLGMKWIPEQDCFKYDVAPIIKSTTKRGVLSLIAKIFDPIGLLSPVIFLAKHIMQKVWRARVSWDEPLPSELLAEWLNFVEELPTLSTITIPRYVGASANSVYELCGFCDASDKGYAAVVYLRVTDIEQKVRTFLLGSKSKLAPMKSTTTPRLELCAAWLLAIWLKRIRESLEEQLVLTGVFAWTDSTIVLSWLTKPQVEFKIFVSNRVCQIIERVPDCRWAHVRSEYNPADCVSRGLKPAELQDHDLYWKGPSFLVQPVAEWDFKIPAVPINQLPELKATSLMTKLDKSEDEWITRFSSYNHMLRVCAWMRRFISLMRKSPAFEGVLSRRELDEVLYVITRMTQRRHLTNLYQDLSNKQCSSSKTLSRLCPFIDQSGVIRVGGRLRNSDITEGRKHPILLPKESHLSVLIARHWHVYACHAGPRLLTALLHKQFWILSVRQVVHHVLRQCTVCVRLTASNPQPIMSDLPKPRVQQCRPFSQVGVDYAGPIVMREMRLRKSREYKAYIAVFICMSVKAVHLELVLDLSTDAFLAAFDRFVARRGLPSDLYSDCGTNFVGAAKQLRKFINHPDNQPILSTARACSWHFNPPSAPHFGGLWEAAVRSAKMLLTRVIGNQRLTLEEMTTVLCRVEAALNSRPLVPLSSDPHDLECLTPGHFLIGQPLLTVSDYDIPHQPVNLRNRWKLIQQCFQSFWKRWSLEYLHQLQLRNQWTRQGANVKIDQMVVIKEAGPPLSWRLGRIIELLPGSDGITRVVKVLTRQGVIVRPVVKLVILPSE